MRIGAIFLSILLMVGCAATPDLLFQNKKFLYDKIVLDIVSAKGSEPDSDSLAYFEEKLNHYHLCKKLIINQRTVNFDKDISLDKSSLSTFESSNRTLKNSEDNGRLNLFVSFLPGPFYKDKDKSQELAGIQYGPTSISIFKDSLYGCESAVLLHEFGHILLIADDMHSPDRKPTNPSRPNHCNNPKCIMYWRVSDDMIDFDFDCRKELAALFDE